MDPTLMLVTTLRLVRDYQQTIDALVARIALLEAQVQQQHPDGVATPEPQETAV